MFKGNDRSCELLFVVLTYLETDRYSTGRDSRGILLTNYVFIHYNIISCLYINL